MKTNHTATFPTHAIRGVAVGGITGGLAMMTIIRLPGFLIATFLGTFGRPGSPDNWQEALISTAGSSLAGVFLSPWGWIGALAGGAIAWRKVNAISRAAANTMTSESSSAPIPARSSLAGEFLLGAGMGLMLFSVGIFPSVMVWMLAFFTLPAAVILLFLGLIGIRRSGLTGLATAKGLLEFTLVFAAIVMAALGGTYASCHMLLPPTMNSGVSGVWWLIAGLSWIIAMLLVRHGFAQWTDFSSRRRFLWCAAVTCFPVAAFLMHFTLASIGLLPLTA